MRIKHAVFIAVICLLLGAALTPIVSPSANSGKGSSCSNPYKTAGANGEQFGDKGVVRSTIREVTLRDRVYRTIIRVVPTSGHRICRVTIRTNNGVRTVSIPPNGGEKSWVTDESREKGFWIKKVWVTSRNK